MKRAFERFDGEIQWVVSDDGQSPAPCTMGQDHIRNKPAADRKSSFLQNLLAGLKHARHDRILFIEDDDWYSPDYLRVMANWLSDAEIAGESRALYYHVPTRRYKVCGNTDHASLCQTGVRGEIAEWMGDHIQKHWRSFIDVHTWKTGARSKRKFLSPKTTLSVGIKGLPGTSGIGTPARWPKSHGLGRLRPPTVDELRGRTHLFQPDNRIQSVFVIRSASDYARICSRDSDVRAFCCSCRHTVPPSSGTSLIRGDRLRGAGIRRR
jgi:hypothetical protein